MFDFSKAVNPKVINKNFILSKVSDNQIFAYYFGNFRLGRKYTSKLRRDDTPSVAFFIGKSGEIVYNDFSTDENFTCFQYVQKLYRCDYFTALRIIANDFGLTEGTIPKVNAQFFEETKNFDRDEKSLCLIQFSPKPWNENALMWWRYYEITEEELVANNVYLVDKVFVNKKEIFAKEGYPMFAYVQNYIREEDGKETQGVKLYNPSEPNHKWLSSIPLHIPFGLDQLKFQSNTCYITKSQKDRIELLKIFPDVIATQNESEAAFPPELQATIFKYFKKAIVVYGADDQGVEACKKFNDKGFGYFNTPRNEYEKYGIEDPADYIRHYGLEMFKDLLREKNLI